MTKYLIQSRNNQTLAVIDPSIEDYERMQAKLVFNGVSTFALTLRRESRYASTFLPDVNKALNNGLLLFVDNEDGNPPVQLLSGPQDDFTLSRKENSTGPLLVSGWSDEYWLQARLALPRPADYPLAGQVGFGVRYFKMAESSGTTAVDSSASALNGAYVGGVTLGQSGLVDDPTTCAKFDGSTGFLNFTNNTGLPTGNSAFTVLGWGMLTAYPAGTIAMAYLGANLSREEVFLAVQSNGMPVIGGNGLSNLTGGVAVPLNIPFLLAMTWDGTTLTGYQFSSTQQGSFGSSTPGAFSLAYGSAQFGTVRSGGGNFWTGFLGHCAVYAANIGNNQVSLFLDGTINEFDWFYTIGLSRQAALAYDTGPNLGLFNAASTGLIYYVQRNASATAAPYSSFGSAQPTAPFTTVLGTRYARPVSGLVCASDPQIGSKAYAAARFDKLLNLLQAIAVQSTPEIGFRLIQAGQQLQFQTYVPTDRTATAIFSLDRGNLRSYDWIYGRSSANYLYTGGLNAGTSLQSRTFGEAGDATAIGQFSLIEDHFDYRKTTDSVTLANVMAAKLVQLRARRNINAVVNDTPSLYFAGPGAKGYGLGDRVSVVMEDGNTYSDIVREVSIDLTPGQPAKVTAAIGTPIDAAILSELDAVAKRFRDEGIQIDVMQTNY